jgi:hypothetical protein
VRVYRINAVNKDGRAVVLGTTDTASQALSRVRDALGDYPRAWVTDETDLDVSLVELVHTSREEQKNGQGS